MHRHTTDNKCYAGFKDFSRAVLTSLREKVPRDWHVYLDGVTDNFRIYRPPKYSGSRLRRVYPTGTPISFIHGGSARKASVNSQ